MMATNTIPGLAVDNSQNIYQPRSIFMQPIGNIYELLSSSQVGNIPIGAGVSVGLCIPEGTMYLKSMQNGGPVTLGYRLMPLDNTQSVQHQQIQQAQPVQQVQQVQSAQPAQQNTALIQKIEELLKKFDERLSALETKAKPQEKGGKPEWQL